MEVLQDKFAFFANFAETIQESLPPEKQAEAYKAICEYGIYGKLPDNPELKMLCLMGKLSIFKQDGRKNNGGARVGAGAPKNNQNALLNKQNNQIQSNSINNNQKQSIPLETETETETEIYTPPTIPPHTLSPYTGNEKCSSDCERNAKFDLDGKLFCGQHTRMELSKIGRMDLLPVDNSAKVGSLIQNLAHANHLGKSFFKKFEVSKSFSFSSDDPDILPYRNAYGDKLVKDVELWLIRNKSGTTVDLAFVCRQFNRFAANQGLSMA